MSHSVPSISSAVQADFLPVPELARLTGFGRKAIYNQHCAGKGPLVPILTKLGGRLGAWREDYEAWKVSQRKFKEAA